jgi:hypothetical protein
MTTKIQPPCWLCFVEGSSRPKRGHATLDEARIEAQRLRDKLPGVSVWIFGPVEKLDPVPLPVFAASGREILRLKK